MGISVSPSTMQTKSHCKTLTSLCLILKSSLHSKFKAVLQCRVVIVFYLQAKKLNEEVYHTEVEQSRIAPTTALKK